MSKTVKFSDFRSNTSDNHAALVAATDYLRKNPGSTLYIEPGIYEITTPLARKIMDECLAGEYGHNPQPVMFNPKFEYSRGIDFDGVQGVGIQTCLYHCPAV